MRLHFSSEETPVILPGLHHYGKVRQLRSTFVDVQPPQVVLYDLDCGLTCGVAVILIDTNEYIKENTEDVTGTHTGIDDPNFFRF